MKKLLMTCGLVLLVTLGFSQTSIALLEVPVRPLEFDQIAAENLELIPFDLEQGMIQVAAELEGEDACFVLDTGAPMLVLNRVPAESANSIVGQSCVSEVTVGLTEVSSFAWAGRHFQELEAAVVDISHLNDYSSRCVAGLIGYEILYGQALILNYQSELAALINPEKITLESYQAPLAQVQMELDGHLPVIELTVNGEVFRFAIDTGAAANLLDATAYNTIANTNIQALPQEELQGLDQAVHRVEAVEIENFQVGDLSVSDRFLVTDLSHLQSESGIQLDGLLGTTFLQQFISCLDYQNERMSFWPLDSEL